MARHKPLSIKELFKLPVGAAFLVYWAKDGDVVNALRLNYTRQVVGSNDGRVILTPDGYEWSTSETVLSSDRSHYDYDCNELDTGRGIATFWHVAEVDDTDVASIADKLDEMCEPLTAKDLWSPEEIAAAFRMLAARWSER